MKIIVSGKEGIGKGELIHALTQEAPEHDYVEVSNEISDMEALSFSLEDHYSVHLYEDDEDRDRIVIPKATHSTFRMRITKLAGSPSDEDDTWRDRARTLLLLFDKQRCKDGTG
jgi:hypothetical protein